jgi:S-formylglutathione hydrolase FrmB
MYQDYLCDELIAHMDQNYHTFGDATHRVIGGHSSGGYGALVAGIQRPDRFRYICSSAGDSYFELSLLPMMNRAIIELERAGGIENFLKRFFDEPSHSSTPPGQIEALLLLNMCSCYAPNPTSRPLLGDLFFDLGTGELIEAVWKRFQAWDPIHMISAFQENVKQLQFVLLESGAQDQHALQLGHRRIARKLVSLGVPHDLVEYPGGHSGHHWRFESRIQRILSLMPC